MGSEKRGTNRTGDEMIELKEVDCCIVCKWRWLDIYSLPDEVFIGCRNLLNPGIDPKPNSICARFESEEEDATN